MVRMEPRNGRILLSLGVGPTGLLGCLIVLTKERRGLRFLAGFPVFQFIRPDLRGAPDDVQSAVLTRRGDEHMSSPPHEGADKAHWSGSAT